MSTIDKSLINATLWRACDTFRGVVSADLYKDYILVMLFIKYLSDTYKEHKEEYENKYNGNEERVKRALSRERFILHENCTFDYLYSKRNDENIGQIIDEALSRIEDDNSSKLRDVFRNITFNSENILGKKKDRNPMLRHLLEDFNAEVLDLRPSKLGTNDIIGDAYEYMIKMFASDAGKKGGEFFTPPEVSELLSCLVKPQPNERIYDPTCGSGSLLIKAAQKTGVSKVQIYGQERNGSTHALCKMNMFLHGIDDAKIEWGDTISNPLHFENNKLMKFQVVVANPPFSLDKWAKGFSADTTELSKKDTFKMDASLDPYRRFEYGVPPKSKGDYAFILHMLNSLTIDGRMAVVLPHGVLFRGAAEGKIRQRIIDDNLLEAVIGLPDNLFFGTGIPAVILVFKQNRIKEDILFIDASKEFQKDKNQNKLTATNIKKIVNQYNRYKSEDKYAYVAKKSEIIENDYNLNIPRYVDTFEEEPPVDMNAVKENIKSLKTEINEVEEQMQTYLDELGL
jgi:type I restriction enzyme M protein